jgi:Helix-turn-helix domain
MLTWEEDVEIDALRKRGWSISAIARHTGRNRRTIRNYLNGVTTPGVRKPAGPDPFEAFVDYVSARLREDPHLWARTLLDEVEELGFTLSYPTLTRNIRDRGLRPDCAACRTATDRPNAIIPHEPGDEPIGTGWIFRIHWSSGGGVAPRICWWGRWRIRPSGAGGCRRAPSSRTWWKAWTGSPGPWAG